MGSSYVGKPLLVGGQALVIDLRAGTLRRIEDYVAEIDAEILPRAEIYVLCEAPDA